MVFSNGASVYFSQMGLVLGSVSTLCDPKGPSEEGERSVGGSRVWTIDGQWVARRGPGAASCLDLSGIFSFLSQ